MEIFQDHTINQKESWKETANPWNDCVLKDYGIKRGAHGGIK